MAFDLLGTARIDTAQAEGNVRRLGQTVRREASDMKRGLTDVTTAQKQVGAQAGRTGDQLKNLGSKGGGAFAAIGASISSAQASTTSLGSSLAGLGGSFASLIGSLGPWGIAIAASAAAVGLFASSVSDAAVAEEALAAAAKAAQEAQVARIKGLKEEQAVLWATIELRRELGDEPTSVQVKLELARRREGEAKAAFVLAEIDRQKEFGDKPFASGLMQDRADAATENVAKLEKAFNTARTERFLLEGITERALQNEKEKTKLVEKEKEEVKELRSLWMLVGTEVKSVVDSLAAMSDPFETNRKKLEAQLDMQIRIVDEFADPMVAALERQSDALDHQLATLTIIEKLFTNIPEEIKKSKILIDELIAGRQTQLTRGQTALGLGGVTSLLRGIAEETAIFGGLKSRPRSIGPGQTLDITSDINLAMASIPIGEKQRFRMPGRAGQIGLGQQQKGLQQQFRMGGLVDPKAADELIFDAIVARAQSQGFTEEFGKSLAAGMKMAGDSLNRNLQGVALEEEMDAIFEGIASAASSSLADGIVDGVVTGFENAEAIAHEFFKTIAKMGIESLLGSIGSESNPSGSGLFGLIFGAASTAAPGAGAVVTPKQFGGLVTTPGIYRLAEREPEMVLRQRDLANLSRGGRGGGQGVDVNVVLDSTQTLLDGHRSRRGAASTKAISRNVAGLRDIERTRPRR